LSLADSKFPSEWMVLARDPRWIPPVVQVATPLWSDDFSNIRGVLR
jgi:hypothetical protein